MKRKGEDNVMSSSKEYESESKNHLLKTSAYTPIEAYSEEWVHEVNKIGVFVRAYPKPNTRKRQDLPSLSEQWKADWKARCKARRKLNVKGSSNR